MFGSAGPNVDIRQAGSGSVPHRAGDVDRPRQGDVLPGHVARCDAHSARRVGVSRETTGAVPAAGVHPGVVVELEDVAEVRGHADRVGAVAGSSRVVAEAWTGWAGPDVDVRQAGSGSVPHRAGDVDRPRQGDVYPGHSTRCDADSARHVVVGCEATAAVVAAGVRPGGVVELEDVVVVRRHSDRVGAIAGSGRVVAVAPATGPNLDVR